MLLFFCFHLGHRVFRKTVDIQWQWCQCDSTDDIRFCIRVTYTRVILCCDSFAFNFVIKIDILSTD